MECIVGAVVWIICGAAGSVICENKGRSALEGFLLGLLLGPIGLIICGVLPKDVTAIEHRALRSGAIRKCPYCAELVRLEARVCRYCGRDIPIGKLDKVLSTGDGMLIYKCRNCQRIYDLAESERCPYCTWADPSRRRIIEACHKKGSPRGA